MASLVFVHGWGYGPDLWKDVRNLLAEEAPEAVDLGYFASPHLPAAEGGFRVAIGHSLGALWLLARAPFRFDRLVAINGFPRFVADEASPSAVPARTLERMRKRFAASPAEVLADFRARCGDMSPPPAALRSESLAEGLGWLAGDDGRAGLAKRIDRTWALAAKGDAIVPRAMTAEAFAALPEGRMRWLENGNHLLPLTHPAECAALIREALAST